MFSSPFLGLYFHRYIRQHGNKLVIRYVNCLRRRSDLTLSEFREYWNSSEFRFLVKRVAEVSSAESYLMSLTLQVEANLRLMEDRRSSEPFDGIIEYWWKDAANLIDIYDSPEGQKLIGEILEFELAFIDLGASSAFFVEPQES